MRFIKTYWLELLMVLPLFAYLIGFTLLFGSMLLRRIRTEVLFRERRTRWVREMILSPEGGA